MGGAQPAGTSAYPDYIESAHELWIGDMQTEITAAVDLNPYSGAYSYDPSDDLDAIDARFQELVSDGETANSGIDWDAMLAEAMSSVDQVVMDATDIDEAVTTFETEHLNTLARSQNRITAGKADINAVNGTAFTIALALAEDGFNTDVAEYRAKIRLQNNMARAQYIQNAIGLMLKVFLSKVDLQKLLLASQSEVSRLRILASKEYLNEEIKLAEMDAMWSIDLLREGGALLGAVAGVGMRKTPMPAWASALSGGLSGGASMASLALATGDPMIGGLIAALGFGIGALTGATQGT